MRSVEGAAAVAGLEELLAVAGALHPTPGLARSGGKMLESQNRRKDLGLLPARAAAPACDRKGVEFALGSDVRVREVALSAAEATVAQRLADALGPR